jgi:hypothetical protein
MNNLTKKILIFVILSILILSTNTAVLGFDVISTQPLNPPSTEVYKIDLQSEVGATGSNDDIKWADINGQATLRFMINGTGDEAETFKLPLLEKIGAGSGAVFFLESDDGVDGNWMAITFAADPTSSGIPTDDAYLYQPLKRGVEYRLITYYGDASYFNSNPDFTSLQVEYFSGSSTQGAGLGGGTTTPAPGSTVVDVDDEPNAGIIERVLSVFLLILGQIIIWLIGFVIGQPISIDMLLFDKFSKTQLTFFGSNANPILSVMKPTLVTLFDNFRSIALTCYLVMLVYMGIKYY